MITNNGFTSIDFGKYADSVGVDWIELEIRLNENSNFQTIRKIMMSAGQIHGINIPEDDDGDNATYVTAIYSEDNPDLGSGASKVFRIRLHDVKRKHQVLGIIDAAKQSLRNITHPKEVVSIKFTAIEIFRDYQSLENDPAKANESNVSMLTYLYKFLRRPANDNHRLSKLSGAEAVPLMRVAYQDFFDGKTLYIGSQKTNKDPVSQRFYNKKTSRGAQLSHKYYRARYEVTLQDEGMPFTTIEEFIAFECQSVAKHFCLNKLANWVMSSLSPAKVAIGSRSHIGGGSKRHKKYTLPNGKIKAVTWTNKYSSSVVADAIQNKKIKTDLENLTKRLNTGLDK